MGIARLRLRKKTLRGRVKVNAILSGKRGRPSTPLSLHPSIPSRLVSSRLVDINIFVHLPALPIPSIMPPPLPSVIQLIVPASHYAMIHLCSHPSMRSFVNPVALSYRKKSHVYISLYLPSPSIHPHLRFKKRAWA